MIGSFKQPRGGGPPSWSLILGLILIQQCLVQLNTCEAANWPLARLISRRPQEPELVGSPDGAELSHQDQQDLAWLERENQLLLSRMTDGAKNIGRRIMDAANNAVAPALNSIELIRRYTSWRNEYNKLRGQFGEDPATGEPILRDVVDVLRIEYAQVDNQLAGEACHSPAEAENVDFIWRVLKLLIDRLEARLEALQRPDGRALAQSDQMRRADAQAELEAERIESSVKNAAERAKRIATKSAVNVAKGELMTILRTFAFDALASFVVNHSQGGGGDPSGANLMSSIEPIILLLGTANTPLIVSYLRGIRFRLTMKAYNDTVSLFACKRRPPSPEQQAAESTRKPAEAKQGAN